MYVANKLEFHKFHFRPFHSIGVGVVYFPLKFFLNYVPIFVREITMDDTPPAVSVGVKFLKR